MSGILTELQIGWGACEVDIKTMHVCISSLCHPSPNPDLVLFWRAFFVLERLEIILGGRQKRTEVC